jgi:hypothetical protein
MAKATSLRQEPYCSVSGIERGGPTFARGSANLGPGGLKQRRGLNNLGSRFGRLGTSEAILISRSRRPGKVPNPLFISLQLVLAQYPACIGSGKIGCSKSRGVVPAQPVDATPF